MSTTKSIKEGARSEDYFISTYTNSLETCANFPLFIFKMSQTLILVYLAICGSINSLPLFNQEEEEMQRITADTTEFETETVILGGNISFYEIDDMMFLTSDRSGQTHQAYRWPKGRIPFVFAPGYSYFEMREIRLAMYYIEEYTCIRFHNRQNSDKNYLYIRRVSGKCSSFVGNIRQGPQQVSLDPLARKCSRPNFPGHVLHELTHAIGFFHEHARDDRDSYVDIRYDYLPKDERTRKNYNRNVDNRIESSNFGVPYNYGSIMHYSGRAGSINGKETIVRKKKRSNGLPQPLEGTMGQREKLSYGDIRMIQTMYAKECKGSVDLDDIPDSDEIPDIDDWMEDRKLSGATMPEMQVEEVTENSVGVINATPEDTEISDQDNIENNPDDSTTSDPDLFVATTDLISTSIMPSLRTSTLEPSQNMITTTKRQTVTRTTTRKIRLTTPRATVKPTTPVVTKTPNLFNLIQYVIHQFAQSG